MDTDVVILFDDSNMPPKNKELTIFNDENKNWEKFFNELDKQFS